MGRPRQPVAVLESHDGKHWTKAELEERRAQEIKPPKPKRITSPAWLPESLKPEFLSIARKLVALNIFCDLDKDTLGRYLVAQQQYLMAAQYATTAMRTGTLKTASEWSVIQDRYFKQARACAGDLGLSISSRCRLIIPEGMRSVGAEAPDDLFGD